MSTSPELLTNVIGGKNIASSATQTRPVINPATEEVLAEMPISSAGDVDAAIDAAQHAFPAWSETPPAERSAALLALAAAIEDDAQSFATLEATNAGKPRHAFIEDELPLLLDNLRFFAGAARTLEGRPAGEYMRGYTSLVRRDPVGVIGQITPWNYPLMMAIWKIGPALATGNTVVMKPAETTPLTTLHLAELAANVLPPGVFNVVAGDGSTGAYLAGHPGVDMVAVTGSPRTGQAVAAAAAANVKRTHLELGGKAPALVFDDADLDAVAQAVAGSGYYNAGQDCTAACRVLASKGVYEKMLELLSAATPSTRPPRSGRSTPVRSETASPPS
jgi:betaine-aldehyde dehydrogenase